MVTRILLNVFYGISLLLLSPWLWRRMIRTGRYRKDLSAKLWGVPRQNDLVTSKPTIWFHGVSVGEIQLLNILIVPFRQKFPHWSITVSSTTDSGLELARDLFSQDRVVPFPFDFSWSCRKTIAAVAPKLIVLAESELWPNFLSAADSAQVPVVVVNGRMSPRSARRMRFLPRFLKQALWGKVTLFLMQTAEYARNILEAGVSPEKIEVVGSMKFDGAVYTSNLQKVNELQQHLGILPEDILWVAGSTHEPEEEIVLSVYEQLRVEFPRLKLILVPRHQDRFDAVAALLAQRGLNFQRRSQYSSSSRGSASVILMDTIGELTHLWSLADIGFTGGSLAENRGGQSMIEPAGKGVPVLFGPNTWNFREPVRLLLAAKAALEVQNTQELLEEMRKLLRDPAARKSLGERARALVISQQGATATTIEFLGNFCQNQEKGNSNEKKNNHDKQLPSC